MFVPNIHYDARRLTRDQQAELMRQAKEEAYEWHVDVLDCNVSVARQRVEMPFEDIMAKFDRDCHFVVIYRRGFPDKRDSDSWRWNLEIGFSTMRGVDHYLWIHLPEQLVEKYTTQYGLKPYDYQHDARNI